MSRYDRSCRFSNGRDSGQSMRSWRPNVALLRTTRVVAKTAALGGELSNLRTGNGASCALYQESASAGFDAERDKTNSRSKGAWSPTVPQGRRTGRKAFT